MKMRLYQGIKELIGTQAEAYQFLINAGLHETDGSWSGRNLVGELVDEGSEWIARFWLPEEREMFDGPTR